MIQVALSPIRFNVKVACHSTGFCFLPALGVFSVLTPTTTVARPIAEVHRSPSSVMTIVRQVPAGELAGSKELLARE